MNKQRTDSVYAGNGQLTIEEMAPAPIEVPIFSDNQGQGVDVCVFVGASFETFTFAFWTFCIS